MSTPDRTSPTTTVADALLNHLPKHEELPMHSLQAALAAYHLADLHREAAAARLAKEASRRDVHATVGADASGGSVGRFDPRRSLARAAANLSGRAADVAHRLDPAIESDRLRRRTQVPGC